MPLPLLFIGIAAATGAVGAGKTVKAVNDNSNADKITKISNKEIDDAKKQLNVYRGQVEKSLENLGSEKVFILSQHVMEFFETFDKIKNMELSDSEGLEELKKLHIDKASFKELKDMGNIAVGLAGGAAAGVAAGALAALGAYGAAGALATASTGTAIATLSGAAATNATLAFFGGGSLAAGGLGMAGGTAVLGGLVAGPALMVMGFVVGAQADKKVQYALANKAEADKIVESLELASDKCRAIRRRTNMYYNLLAHLDSYFLPLIWEMEDVTKNEGFDYSVYKPESKKIIASALSSAGSIKVVLDTPILSKDGELTDKSAEIEETVGKLIYK